MRGHISGQYDTELDSIRNSVLQMGGLVELQLHDACEGLLQRNESLCQDVRLKERDVNALEVQIDDACNHIIARRSPTAGDLRMIMTLLKATTDLERIGDESDRIARMALELCELDYPKDQYRVIRPLMKITREQLRSALDAFARTDVPGSISIIAGDKILDARFKSVVREIKDELREDPASVDRWICLMWVARALERVGDHAKNLCEYLIYMERGEDIRHSAPPPA